MSVTSVRQGIQGTLSVKHHCLVGRSLLYSLVQFFLVLLFMCAVQNSFKLKTDDNSLLYFWYLIIFVLKGWHKGQPYTKDTKVKNFIQWTRTQSEANQMRKTVIGGYYPFPRPPNNFLKYCKNNKGITLSNIFKISSLFQLSLTWLESSKVSECTNL